MRFENSLACCWDSGGEFMFGFLRFFALMSPPVVPIRATHSESGGRSGANQLSHNGNRAKCSLARCLGGQRNIFAPIPLTAFGSNRTAHVIISDFSAMQRENNLNFFGQQLSSAIFPLQFSRPNLLNENTLHQRPYFMHSMRRHESGTFPHYEHFHIRFPPVTVSSCEDIACRVPD